MNYYLGVDAGGTKTYAIITDESGRWLASGTSGPGNHQINADIANANIKAAVFQALNHVHLQPADIRVAWFGLAGADREADYRVLTPMIQQFGFPDFHIVCDTIIAMRAGTTKSYGAVLVCGTGMNAAGIGKQGETVQCGGFGYSFGDFGGGEELSIEAFRTVIRAWEGRGMPTLLTGLIPQALGYGSVAEMFHSFLDHHKRIPSDLTKLIFDAAAREDNAAIQILQRQGTELGLSARAVIERLQLQGENFDLVLAGSVLTKGSSEFIHPYISKEVLEVAPGCQLKLLTVEPVVGSILLAMEKDGITITSSIYEKLDEIADIKGVVCNGK
ncbi:ATPase [Paenibacillus helianthi]|uniref:ATPase n=1 Tax=Paenibacillus helianthi TaxID=1349432 RepID=A0ABX3ER71_9BACL|nr:MULTISPECIES: BadF/BadG/BcrA/BcrD ATPase family protein [Paenibacillus]OKP82316.1 ATPase [Paenibacillus sp. P3E]OKP84481.1 ATPase [Paenibacillus sp. P32E]OKP86796.1 ATPase [Paenibacillus helianthi]